MADANCTEKGKLSKSDLKQIKSDVYAAGLIFASILQLAKETDADYNMPAFEALCEKGGYLTDRCLSLFGTPGIHGTFEGWAGLTRTNEPEVTA